MSAQIGNLPSTGVRQVVKRTYQSQGKKVVEYVIRTSDEATFLAGYTIGTSTDIASGLTLGLIDTQESKTLTRVTLTYMTVEAIFSYGNSNGSTKSSDSSIDNAPQYSYTDIVSSFTFSEANIISGVGSLSAPTGMTSPTTDKWLKTGRSVSPVGDKFQIVDTWEYVS